MKLLHFIRPKQSLMRPRLGLMVDESTVIDVQLQWQQYYESIGANNPLLKAAVLAPAQLSDLLQVQDSPINFFKETLSQYQFFAQRGDFCTQQGEWTTLNLKDEPGTKLTCPVDKINQYRDFYTHEKHVKTGFAKRQEPIPPDWYEVPVYYKGSTATFIGPGDDIQWPSFSQEVDYELELAAVIGKRGKNISKERAFEHILGFTILNDMSARDLQRREMKCRLGPSKSKDYCSILGPVIVTADEFQGKDPNLLMLARINGEEWSRGYSGESHFSWAEMIAHAAQEEMIYPCDVFGSGTVGTGCGLELGKLLRRGDVIELEIEGIGVLKNKLF